MQTKKQIDTLWDGFRTAIDAAYKEADKKRDDNGTCLRDYAQNISWSDALAGLLSRETANERQHRRNEPPVPSFSPETAAKLILMNQAHDGARLRTMPRATEFLVFRQSAAEARVIGFLAKRFLPMGWREAIAGLDYSKLMQNGNAPKDA
jgi:hypothetical protein